MTENTLQSSGCTHGNIRLVNGETVYGGRVEICINKVWGTVCSTNSTNFWSAYKWTSKDTNVVCRQLQHMGLGMKYKIIILLDFCCLLSFYTIIYCIIEELIIISNYHIILIMLIHTGSVAYSTATHYGSGTGLILLSSIDCLGNETSLLECRYSPFHSCSHTLDVGVKCEGMAVPCTVSIDARPNTF